MASNDFVARVADAAEPPPAGVSALSWHGTVESCYGPPWSHADRLAHLEFSARVGFNTYVHAPKDDPYQRERWREPYPAAELAQLGELADTARALGIRFVVTISPGLSMQFAGNADHEALIGKADLLWGAGVSSFGLLFDDVPPELSTPADVVRFGPGRGGLGRPTARPAGCSPRTFSTDMASRTRCSSVPPTTPAPLDRPTATSWRRRHRPTS